VARNFGAWQNVIRRLLFRHFNRVHRVGEWFRLHFTPAGHLLLGAMMFCAVFGIDTTQAFAYQLFTLSAALLLVSVIGGAFFRPKLELKRILPPYATAEEPLHYRLQISNQGKRTQHGLFCRERLHEAIISYHEFQHVKDTDRQISGNRFDDFVGYPRWVALREEKNGAAVREQTLPALLPRVRTEVAMEIKPWRRGYVRFAGLYIICPDPLGLFKTFRHYPCEDNVLVLPKRYHVPPLNLPGKRRYQQGGISMAMSVGDSVEFVSLREYRPGDPLRHMHWKSWARLGKPVVKEFQDEFFTRHALILDTFNDSEAQIHFEEAVSLAASFTCHLLGHENLLDLLFVGTDLYQITGGRGLTQLDKMLEVLACVELCQDKSFDSLLPMVLQHLSNLSACVCVFLTWNTSRQALYQALKKAGLPVVALVVTTQAAEKQDENHVYFIHPEHIERDLAQLNTVK
jgi:uncharacterized protein (DUF58 family)